MAADHGNEGLTMKRFDKYLSAIWRRYGMVGIVIVVTMGAGLAILFRIPVSDWLSRLLGL